VPVSCLSAMGIWRNEVVLTAAGACVYKNNVCHSPLTYVCDVSFVLNRRILDTRAESSPKQPSWGDASHVRPTLLTIFVFPYAVLLTLWRCMCRRALVYTTYTRGNEGVV
jgi:hypothetical protein